jgi:hypothetical protein
MWRGSAARITPRHKQRALMDVVGAARIPRSMSTAQRSPKMRLRRNVQDPDSEDDMGHGKGSGKQFRPEREEDL